MKAYFSILIFSIYFVVSSFKGKTLELTGKVTSEHGFVIPKTYVQILEKGEIIAQTKTDNFGKYKILIPKVGKFTIRAGYKNKFFHSKKIENCEFTLKKNIEKNFVLIIDKQVLHEECSRLRESYRHMIHNSKNLGYRRSFLNRFPKSGLEMELFFSSEVLDLNLKKEAKKYLNTIFERNFTGRTTYIILFVKFAQKTDMRTAKKNTRTFYNGAVEIINKNKEVLFNELQNLDEKYVLNFFLWMFSGGSYGKQKMDTSFDYLEPKYPETYNLMVYAHENYLKTL